MGRKVQAPPKLPQPSSSHSSPEPPPPFSASSPGEERITVDRRTDYSVTCKWTIPNFGTIKSKAVYSPYVGVSEGVDCRLVLYPRGNSGALPGSLSLYLHVMDPRSFKFDCFIYYKMGIQHNLEDSKSLQRDSCYRFTAKKKAHGWIDFALASTVVDPKLGFISNGSLEITADIRVLNESTSFAPDNKESKMASWGSGSSGPCLSVHSGKFTWTVKNFSSFSEVIQTAKLMSPSFPAGECELWISVFKSPVDKVENLCLYLESNLIDSRLLPLLLDSKETDKMFSFATRSCWCVFRMSVLNQKSRSDSIHLDLHGRFGTATSFLDNKSSCSRSYMKMSKFIEPENGFLVDDTAVFTVSFQAIQESYEYFKIARSPRLRNPILLNDTDWYQEAWVWKIKNFTWLKDFLKKRKVTGLAVKSRTLKIGNQDCRLVVYPRGKSQKPGHLSFYLEFTDKRNTSLDLNCILSYRLSVINQKTSDKSFSKNSMERVSNSTKELGWSEFMTLNSLLDQDSGFLVGDTISCSAEVNLSKETFLTGISELRNAGFPVDPSGKGDFFLWRMDNFSSFKRILKTRKIASRTFQVGGCELQIGVCNTVGCICAYLECDPSVMDDPDKNFWVSYRMALANQKNFAKSMWKESSFCTKSTSNSGIQFLNVSDIMDPDAGYLVNDSIAFCCQILDHCPWFDFSEPGVSASHDSQNLLSNDADKLRHSKCSEAGSENEDDIFGSICVGAGHMDMRRDCCSQLVVTKRIWMDVDWICSTTDKLCIYLGETVKTKDLLSVVKNLVNCDVKRAPFLEKLWTLMKMSQQLIVNLLLDILVEFCKHSETSNTGHCFDTSAKPSGHVNGVVTQAEISKKNGPEDSGQTSTIDNLTSRVEGIRKMSNLIGRIPLFPAVKSLDERRNDMHGKAILGLRPLETSAKALLKIKWPEQSGELLGVIIHSLKDLDVTVPEGCSNPKQWPVSAQRFFHVLGIAPKHLQLDLVLLVPKLLDHSEHPAAACSLLHHLMKSKAGPDLHVQVFAAINQLGFSSDVWEHLFVLTSELVMELNNGALATALGFLIKTASHCQHISEAVRVIRARLCSLGVEVSPCVLIFLRETIHNFGDIAKAFLRDIDYSFEPEKKYLGSFGEAFLFHEELLSTRLSMMNGLLHEDRHFSDVFILLEMLSVPSLTGEAFQVFERAVARKSVVVPSVATVLERKSALKLPICPVSVAGKTQQSCEALHEKIESSFVERDEFALSVGLAETLSISKDSGVQQFAKKLYATLFRLFDHENHHKRILKGLVDRAISDREHCHLEGIDFYTLLHLVNEEQGLARQILNMMKEVAKSANDDCEKLKHRLRASEDHNLCKEEEKRIELADMVTEKTSLLERLSKSEAASNHYKSELKLEKDRSAREKKELSERIRELESQLEWIQSEQNNEITKLSAEKKVFKDRLKILETQISQTNSQNSDDFKRLVKEKHTLAGKLMRSEAARKRSEEELKCYAPKIRILEDDRDSLRDEVGQLKLTVGELEQGKLDNEGKIKHCEKYIGEIEANISAFQQHVGSLEVSLLEEMTQHAPLYGVGLEDLSANELETCQIHQEGLAQIYALQQRRGSLSPDLSAIPSTFPNFSSM